MFYIYDVDLKFLRPIFSFQFFDAVCEDRLFNKYFFCLDLYKNV